MIENEELRSDIDRYLRSVSSIVNTFHLATEMLSPTKKQPFSRQ